VRPYDAFWLGWIAGAVCTGLLITLLMQTVK